MNDVEQATKFTDRNKARRIADQHMRQKPDHVCKILNVPQSKMFLYIALFNKSGKFIGVLK